MSSAELALLINVASQYGFFTTFLLCVLTGIVGGSMVRFQGLQTIWNIQTGLIQGKAPTTEIVSGMMLLIIGALLIVPGFITDTMGFILLIPVLRKKVAVKIVQYFTNYIGNHVKEEFNSDTNSRTNQMENFQDFIIDVDVKKMDEK